MTCGEKIASEAYGELLTDYEISGADFVPDETDSCQLPVDEEFGIYYFKRQTDGDIDLTRYPYFSFPKCYGLMQESVQPAGLSSRPESELTLADAGILQVQQEPLSLTGRGVILGIIDSGIRYTLDAFRNRQGDSRILAIWDQQDMTGVSPNGFFYGSEYNREQIGELLMMDPPPRTAGWDENGHGTGIAGVAAGSDTEALLGAAPDAELAVVKLREAKAYLREYYVIPENAVVYAETDIVLAVKYLVQLAETQGKPLVICLGIGSSYGSHTGRSVLDRYLDKVTAQRGFAVVVCGGNEGAAARHVQNFLTEGRMEEELRVGEGEAGFLLEIWLEGPGQYTLSIRSPGGEETDSITANREERRQYEFVFEETQISATSIPLEPSTARSLILLRILRPTPGIWTFRLTAGGIFAGSRYHMWLPITDFLQSETYFLRPDPDVTLTAPSMAQNVITINAYDDRDGSFYEKSGRGFTADRRNKPDFAAPGVEVSTVFGKKTGSSMAAAIAAGGVAQMLQWAVTEGNYPLASSREIKYYLALGAVRVPDVYYPDRKWGLGKINIERTFRELAGLYE